MACSDVSRRRDHRCRQRDADAGASRYELALSHGATERARGRGGAEERRRRTTATVWPAPIAAPWNRPRSDVSDRAVSGPTEDDVTRDAVALGDSGAQLDVRQEILDWIEERFRRMGRKMAEINKRQAFIIDGAEVLPNPNGHRPGTVGRS